MTTFLVMDDDALAQQQLRQLGGEGEDLRIISAFTGAEGLSVALDKNLDLVVLSAQLGDADWLDVLSTLHQEARHTPIILTTSRGSMSQAVQAFRAGACDYVTKPLDPSKMAKAIVRAEDAMVLR